MKLIDKSVLVAEIKRLAEVGRNNASCFDEYRIEKATWLQQADVCDRILSFLDTLEVKGVDLEKEVEDYWHNSDLSWCRDAYSMTHIRTMLSSIAKHFFELGFKAQKGESV